MRLKVNIHDIRESKSAQIQDNLIIKPGELDLPVQEGITWQQFAFEFVLTNAGNLFVLQGKLESFVTLECSRCLKPIDFRLELDVLEHFSHHPIKDGDDETHLFHGEEIDLTGVLRENILLNLPAKPLCSPDCLGLCPHCGTDRNLAVCDCNPKTVDPRLAVLEKLISK